MQVVHVLDHHLIEAPADRDVVEDGQMLHVLTQADAAGMRADRHPEVRRQQQNRDHLVDTAKAACVDLAKAHGPGLKELLEHHPVMDVLSGSHPDRGDLTGDRRVPEHIVRAGRLFDPQRRELRQTAHVADGLVNIPDLISVEEQVPVGAEFRMQQRGAAEVVVNVGANLQLEVPPAASDSLPRQGTQLVVVIPKPASRGAVSRDAIGEHLSLPVSAPGHPFLE